MLENVEGAIKNRQSRETDNTGYTRRRKTKQKQSRETDNTGYTRRRKTKQKHSTIYIGHHCAYIYVLSAAQHKVLTMEYKGLLDKHCNHL